MGMDLKEGIIEEDERKASKPKVIREMKKLQGWYNPEATYIIDASISVKDVIIDQDNFSLMARAIQRNQPPFRKLGNIQIEDCGIRDPD